MKTYKTIFEICPDGGRQVLRYVCAENPEITIDVERGSISHNRPTGYTVKKNGSTDWTQGIASYLTLSEAKDAVEYYFKDEENDSIQVFKFDTCFVRVIDCTNDVVNFRVAEVFDFNGKKVHEIRTTTKGKKAATLAEGDARRFRII